MADPIVTNNDLGSVILEGGKFRDDTLNFSGADVYAPGTILARKAVADAVTAAADGGNTGDGTVTVATVVPGAVVPLVGIYVLTCTALIANGGEFKLADPNGAIVATALITGAATVVEVAGLQFTVSDGATDHAVDDFFTLTVAAVDKLVAYAIAGAGGAQIPKAVLTYEVIATGAGDIPIRDMITGTVRKGKLIIDLDGDDSNIDDAILDQLRDYTLLSIDVQELNIQDNQ